MKRHGDQRNGNRTLTAVIENGIRSAFASLGERRKGEPATSEAEDDAAPETPERPPS